MFGKEMQKFPRAFSLNSWVVQRSDEFVSNVKDQEEIQSFCEVLAVHLGKSLCPSSLLCLCGVFKSSSSDQIPREHFVLEQFWDLKFIDFVTCTSNGILHLLSWTQCHMFAHLQCKYGLTFVMQSEAWAIQQQHSNCYVLVYLGKESGFCLPIF